LRPSPERAEYYFGPSGLNPFIDVPNQGATRFALAPGYYMSRRWRSLAFHMSRRWREKYLAPLARKQKAQMVENLCAFQV
jgi:hypothetical protein